MDKANRLVALSVVLSLVLVAGADVTIYAKEGDDVTLPCHTDPPVNLKSKAFDWKKGRQDVFFFNKGQHYGNTLMGQDDKFKDRVSLPQGGLQAGNASIILSNVTTKDGGEYTCVLLSQDKLRRQIQLIVERKSEPGMTATDLGSVYDHRPYAAIGSCGVVILCFCGFVAYRLFRHCRNVNKL